MKRIFLYLILLFSVQLAFAADYSKIDKQSATVPSTLSTAPQITAYLVKNITSPTEKVRAIYYWITHNIRYDVSQLSNVDMTYYSERNLLSEVLQTHQGVCQHYAELLNACCASAGIKSYVIVGYTKTGNDIAKISHAWNAVVIDGKYYEIDATWAAGYVDKNKFTPQFNDTYFLVSPAEFIKTHVPFDPIWQFSDNPVSNKEFMVGDFSKLKIHSDCNFSDSISIAAGLDTINSLIRINQRIRGVGLTNDMIRNYVSRNQFNISQLKYNKAVSEFNKGVESYNIYITYKNKQFNSASMETDKIMELLSSARTHTETAENILKFLNTDNAAVLRNIDNMQSNIENQKANISYEEDFMKKYSKTWKPLRIFKFYKFR